MAVNKAKRHQWEEIAMENALRSIKEKEMGWSLAAKTFNVPATTLRQRYKEDQGSKKIGLGGHRTILSYSIKEELNMHIIDMETRLFGLTTKDLR